MYRYIQVCTGTYRYVPVHTRKNKNVAYAFQLVLNQRPPAYQRLVSPPATLLAHSIDIGFVETRYIYIIIANGSVGYLLAEV